MITVHGTPNCGACKSFMTKLDEKKLEYVYSDNADKTIDLGQKYGIYSAPVVEIDGKYFNRADALKKLKI